MAYVLMLFWDITSFFLCNIRNAKLSFHKNKLAYMILFTLGCSTLMGLRNYTVGSDTISYQEFYNLISVTPLQNLLGGFFFDSMEIGFVLLMKFCSFISSNYYFFQLVISLLYCGGMSKFLYDNCQNCIWSSFVFLGIGLFLLAFNAQRQMLAIMVAVNSWHFYINKKYKLTIILLALACLTHISSLIFVLAYIVYRFRKQKFVYVILLAGILGAIVYYQNIINLLAQHISIYGNYYSNTKELQTAGLVKILWAIITLISIIVLGYRQSRMDQLRTYAIFSLIYVATNLIGLNFNYFERIGWIFLPFVVLLFDGFSSILTNKVLSNVYYVGCLLSFMLYFLISSRTEQYIYQAWL